MWLLPSRFIYAFFGAGLFTFITAATGLVGAARNNRVCLGLYAFLAIVLLLAQVRLMNSIRLMDSYETCCSIHSAVLCCAVLCCAVLCCAAPCHASCLRTRHPVPRGSGAQVCWLYSFQDVQ